jgi:hypothetical protein
MVLMPPAPPVEAASRRRAEHASQARTGPLAAHLPRPDPTLTDPWAPLSGGFVPTGRDLFRVRRPWVWLTRGLDRGLGNVARCPARSGSQGSHVGPIPRGDVVTGVACTANAAACPSWGGRATRDDGRPGRSPVLAWLRAVEMAMTSRPSMPLVPSSGPFVGFAAAAGAAVGQLNRQVPGAGLWLVTRVVEDRQLVIASAGEWAERAPPEPLSRGRPRCVCAW